MQPLLSFRCVLCLKNVPFYYFFKLIQLAFFSRTGLGTEYSINPFKKKTKPENPSTEYIPVIYRFEECSLSLLYFIKSYMTPYIW